jgi:hypothetical protein
MRKNVLLHSDAPFIWEIPENLPVILDTDKKTCAGTGKEVKLSRHRHRS